MIDKNVLMRQLSEGRRQWEELSDSHAEWERAMVNALRGLGATWRDVGEALHTTRQAAWERFGTGTEELS